MPTPPCTRVAIVQLIKDRGPLTAAELTEILQMGRKAVNGSINNTRKKTTLLRIAAWRRTTGRGGREIPVYGLGPGPDEPRPELGDKARNETRQRYAEKMRDVINTRLRLRRRKVIGNPFAQLLAPASRHP